MATQIDLQQGLIFGKTLQGNEEVRTRALGLERTNRLLLILIDGLTPTATLIEKLPDIDNVPSLLAQLWRDGLIEPVVVERAESDPTFNNVGPATEAPVFAYKPGASYLPKLNPITMAPLAVEPGMGRNTTPFGAVEPQAPIDLIEVAPPIRASGPMTAPPAYFTQVSAPAPMQPEPSLWQAWLAKLARKRYQRQADKRQDALSGGASKKLQVLFVVTVLLIAGSFALPFVPMSSAAGDLSAKLSAACGTDVTIGQASYGLWPAPRAILSNVSGNGLCAISASKVVIHRGWAGLFGTADVTEVEVDGVTLSASALPDLLKAFDKNGLNGISVPTITLGDAAFKVGAQEWRELDGTLRVTQNGGFNLQLRQAGAAFRLDLKKIKRSDDLAFEIGGKAWALPMITPAQQVDDVLMQGHWVPGKTTVDQLSFRMVGGEVTGQLQLQNSAAGWALGGTLIPKGIDLAKWVGKQQAVIPEGVVNGQLRLLSQSKTLENLFESPQLSGNVMINEGVLTGVELLDLANSAGKRVPMGGRTQFQTLAASYQWTKKGGQLDGFKLQNSAVLANGRIAWTADGKVTGNLALSAQKLRVGASSWRFNGNLGALTFDRIGGEATTPKTGDATVTPSNVVEDQ